MCLISSKTAIWRLKSIELTKKCMPKCKKNAKFWKISKLIRIDLEVFRILQRAILTRLESASHLSAPAYGAVLQVAFNRKSMDRSYSNFLSSTWICVQYGAKHSPLAVKSAYSGVLRKCVITLGFFWSQAGKSHPIAKPWIGCIPNYLSFTWICVQYHPKRQSDD